MKAFLLAAALVIALAAGCERAAADDLVSWQHPTTRQDGTPVAVSDIRGTILRWRASPTASTLDGTTEIAAPARTATIARPDTPGNRCYSLATILKDGAQSNFTNDVCRVIEEPAPAAKPRVPRNVAVQAAPAP